MPETDATHVWVCTSKPMIDKARGTSRLPSAPQQSLKARFWLLIPASPFLTRRSRCRPARVGSAACSGHDSAPCAGPI